MITVKRRQQLNRSSAPKNHEEQLHDALLRLKERWHNSRTMGTEDRRIGKILLSEEEESYIDNLLYGIGDKQTRWPRRS